MLAFARDGLWRPRSAFFQSVVDAIGVSRERIFIVVVSARPCKKDVRFFRPSLAQSKLKDFILQNKPS